MSILSSVKHAATVAKNGHAGLLAKKFAPQILLGAGVVGVVASTVLASKATLSLEKVLDTHRENIDLVNKGAEAHPSTEYSSTHHKRDLTLVHMHTFKELTKLYALPVGLGILSISMIIGSHGIQYKRNVAAVAAYKTVESQFNRYRDRVREEFGVEKDEEFSRAYRSEGVIDEEGNEIVNVTVDGKRLNDTLYFFEPSNINWKNSPEYNLSYVKCQETFANQRLSARGHLFLNEVLDDLGLPHTKEGAILGWVLDENGSNNIDLGITDCQSPSSRIYGTDREFGECIMLDIKTDGIIWDKI
ncbi:membrane protein [Arthrobacter phage Tokki]|nr:membrane protein [Arthrobacter phage Tokki]